MFRHQIYQLGYTHPPFHTSYLDDCRGGTPWPPQFFDEGVLRRIGAALRGRPNSSTRACCDGLGRPRSAAPTVYRAAGKSECYACRMEQELNFRIILEDPPAGVDYGLQKGGGNDYEVVQKQRSKSGNLTFEFTARVKEGKDGQPVLLGPFTQGPVGGRFAYLDIGTYAGQMDTPWSRRLKIPFRDITWDVVKKASKRVLETQIGRAHV